MTISYSPRSKPSATRLRQRRRPLRAQLRPRHRPPLRRMSQPPSRRPSFRPKLPRSLRPRRQHAHGGTHQFGFAHRDIASRTQCDGNGERDDRPKFKLHDHRDVQQRPKSGTGARSKDCLLRRSRFVELADWRHDSIRYVPRGCDLHRTGRCASDGEGAVHRSVTETKSRV